MAYYRVEDGPWPVGTTVAAYLTSSLVGGQPVGMAVSNGVASANGVVEFGGLTEGSTYTAFGHGGTQQFVAMNQEARIEALEAAGPSGGGGAVTPFKPEDYGAVRNGVTDDSAAITSAINAAVAACIADGTYYCEVQFSAGIYQVTRATVKGGATLGNAQIPLPVVVPETTRKVILRLKGAGRASTIHWAQTQTMTVGTVIRTTLTGQTSDGTWGAPSVIGCPTTQVGSNGLAPFFSNIHVVIDGLTVMGPANPSLIAVDLREAGQASVLDLACHVEATAGQLNTTPPTNAAGVGLYMPAPGNNAVADIDAFTCQGWYYGLALSEHVAARRVLIVECNTALFVGTSRNAVATSHASVIAYMCAEAVSTVIEADTTSGVTFALHIVALDLEVANAGTHIVDSINILRGEIGWHDNQGIQPRVNGASNLRIVETTVARGAFTPSLPASTVASTPIYRDMALTVSGGTVTAISVDGTAQGVTSGTVIVPSGKAFAITYSVAPTLRAVKL
jgi:hypothetical protein